MLLAEAGLGLAEDGEGGVRLEKGGECFEEGGEGGVHFAEGENGLRFGEGGVRLVEGGERGSCCLEVDMGGCFFAGRRGFFRWSHFGLLGGGVLQLESEAGEEGRGSWRESGCQEPGGWRLAVSASALSLGEEVGE